MRHGDRSQGATRRNLLAAGLAGGGLAALTPGLAARAAVPHGQATVSLLDVLTAAERSDVQSGRNRLDLTEKFSGLLARVAAESPGAIVDCGAWRGEVRWSANPFAEIPRLPATLLTGDVTFVKDFNEGPVYVPSSVDWRMTGTRFRPLVPLTAIRLDASPANAMVMSWMTTVLFDGRAGERSLTLTSPGFARYVVPGQQIGLIAALPNDVVEQRLAAAMSARDGGFGFADPASAGAGLGAAPGSGGASTVHLLIDDEIVRCRVDDRGRVSQVQRGAEGSRATTHARGAAVRPMTTLRLRVVAVRGQTLSLDGPLPRSFVGGRAVLGAVDATLSGAFEIDGNQSRESPSQGVWLALSSVLGTRFTTRGGARLRRTPHGGFMQWGCVDSRVEGALIEDCGRPELDLGAAIWGFGGGSGNRVRFGEVRGGHLGVALDNKSYGIPGYGMIDGETGGDYRVDVMEGVEHSVAISGCSGNRVSIGRLNADAVMPDFDDAASSRQTSRAVSSQNNSVDVEVTSARPEARGRDARRNGVTVNGRAAPVL